MLLNKALDIRETTTMNGQVSGLPMAKEEGSGEFWAPLLPSFVQYPTRDKFLRYLIKLEKILRANFLSSFRKLCPPKATGEIRRRVLGQLAEEIKDLRHAFEIYIEANIGDIAAMAFRELPRELRTEREAVRKELLSISLSLIRRPGVRFSSLIQDGLYRKVARQIDNVEEQLMPELREVVFVERRLVERTKREFAVWFKLVRLCIAVVIIRSIPYQEIWDHIYGEAGYWLSEEIPKIAKMIQTSSSYGLVKKDSQFLPLIPQYVTFSDVSMMQFPIEEYLKEIDSGAMKWRDGCKLNPCTVSDLGVKYPWTFHPIDGLLFGSEPKPDPFPDQMYTRLAAEDRAQKVSRFWNFVRGELIRSKIISEPDEFQFAITAGSLRHGGAHPPHKTHRDGSMFDMVLIGLPNLVLC